MLKRLGLLGVLLAGTAATVSSSEPGLKIRSRETLPAHVIETLEYVGSARKRIETRIEHVRSAQIIQCDKQRSIFLDYNERTYRSFLEYNDAAFASARFWSVPDLFGISFARFTSREAIETRPPTVVIETTTVQTGERKTVFGFTARRVITTRRELLPDATPYAPDETVTDGWYIDLDPRPSCQRTEATGAHAVLVATTIASDGSGRRTVPHMTFKDLGAPERGFPIETRTTSRGSYARPDGRRSDWSFTTHKVVVELATEPLDPALFEIPAGFRNGEGFLAAVAAPWTHAWRAVERWVEALTRFSPAR